MLFIEGLAKPLDVCVKASKLATLQDHITKTQNMGDLVPKAKFPSKPIIPQRNKDKKPFQRDWIGKDKLDDETQGKLRRKKLCFTCKEPLEPGHKCWGKQKVHYIEVMSNIDDEEHAMPTLRNEPIS